jgi:hypothetical protein
MGTKHKHYDVIVAWAAGEEIEYQTALGVWKPTCGPPLNEFETFRIKPKRVKKEGWVNVFKYPTNSADRAAIVSNAFFTKEAADAELGLINRIACIRIEWEEEE